MLKLITPILLSSILLAENTPNLAQQFQEVEQAQENMLSDFTKIKKKREREAFMADLLEKERLAKVAEEKRLNALKVKEAELARKNALQEAREAEEKRKVLEAQERKADELRKQVKAKKIEASRRAEKRKTEVRKKKSAAKKKRAKARIRAKKRKAKVKTKPIAPLVKKVQKRNSLDVLNDLLNE